jgi:hypothetical protein
MRFDSRRRYRQLGIDRYTSLGDTHKDFHVSQGMQKKSLKFVVITYHALMNELYKEFEI